ncbi:MAG: hypothetical protein HY597_00005 [Candidatus Omnitrophica bacterium]|nr:hypothetical protein [Candidatus Omnitrophota bacterium]
MIPEVVLRKLYVQRGLSMMEISQALQATHATILYWMKKHKIPRRTWSESMYVKLNPDGDPFTIPRHLSARQRELLVAGILLYWAEGSKKREALQLVNLDARMLQLFLKFLRNVCHVDERRVGVYVRVYKQFPVSAARTYWSKALQLPKSRVFVAPHTDQRSKASKQWSRYGIATLEFHNTKLKRWLDNAIEEYIGKLLGKAVQRSIAYPIRGPRERFFVRDEELEPADRSLLRPNGDTMMTDGSMPSAAHDVTGQRLRCLRDS